MGRGDIKTKKGKIAAGSYGVSRPRKTTSTIEVKPAKAKKKAAPKTKKTTTAKKPSAKKKATSAK
tara:strand:+ start:254 stop:448 length:195 start_codon:yes stop_codon:yes gene_type:complete